MLNSKWLSKLVLAATLFCAAGAPVLAQDTSIPNTPMKQETEIRNADGSKTEIERERNANGTGSVEVDRDWSTGTWLAIGLGVLLLAGIGYAISRRDHTHYGTPVNVR
jgi:hypothetical protein